MNGAIKLLSRIFKILKILEIKYPKFATKNFEFSKNGIYLKEPYQVCMCTKLQVNVLKNDQLMAF